MATKRADAKASSRRSGRPKTKARQGAANTSWHGRFLAAYSLTHTIAKASALVGVPVSTFRNHVHSYPDFARQYEDAKEADTQELEAEARRRAVEGLVRKKFGKDGKPLIDPETQKQYTEREYSDTVLIFLLKARRPEVYRDYRPPAGGEAPGTAEEPSSVKDYDSELAKHWKANASAPKK